MFLLVDQSFTRLKDPFDSKGELRQATGAPFGLEVYKHVKCLHLTLGKHSKATVPSGVA